MTQILFSAKGSSAKIGVICGRSSACEIEIRTAHEIMAARATQLALLVDQLMPALQTIPPVLAGNIFGRPHGTTLAFVLLKFSSRIFSRRHKHLQFGRW